jgi:hypothetical protein
MTDPGQKVKESLREKRGVPIYETNPSVPDIDSIKKQKKVRVGDDKKGFIIDNSSGEVLSVGGAGFYEFEEVDSIRFVKLFLDGVKQVAGLSKTGLVAFELVYRQMQKNYGTDKIELSYDWAKIFNPDINDRTYRRGVKELLDKEILFRSLSDGVFFVNIRYMFNGDRLAFVKGYKRKFDNAKQIQ